MTTPPEIPSAVIGVDWSGRKGPDQVHHIRAAVVTESGIDVWADLTRESVVGELLELPGPIVIGFDFSFGFPEWVARCHGFGDGTQVWPLVAAEGESWLAAPEPPFFGAKGSTRPTGVPLLRRSEAALGAKSIFQLQGAGHVGTGSLRGMPWLLMLRAAGCAVWPFDAAGRRTVVEIYPSALRRVGHEVPIPRRVRAAMAGNDNTRDAVESACVMWEHRASFASLTATTDPVTLVEGDVWMPGRT